MTPSNSFNNKPAFVVLSLIVAAALGCGDSSSDDPCTDNLVPSIAGVADTAVRRAAFTIEHAQIFTAPKQSTETKLATLSLVDSTSVKRVSRKPEAFFSATCFSLTGAPTDICRDGFKPPCVIKNLSAEAVEVIGPAVISLDKKAEGKYVQTKIAAEVFGKSEFGVKVTGRSDSKYFASYQQTLPPPAPLEISAPAPGDPVGNSDLELKWNKGSGTYVEIAIQIAKPKETDKVICLVRDDGCHSVPAGALDWLRNGTGVTPADAFRVTIKRVVSAVKEIDGKTAAEIKGVRKVILPLVQ